MAEIKHTSYRLPESTRKKLLELAELDGITQTQVINNLIQAEHRYRREEIEKRRKTKEKGSIEKQ